MKKIFPSILIILILVNIFAPFTLGFNAINKPTIKKSIAEAGSMTIGITQENTTENSIKFAFNITRAKTAHHKLIYLVSDKPGATMPDYNNIKASITSTNAELHDYNYNNDNPPTAGDIKPVTGSQVLAHGKLDLGSDGTTSDTNADFVTESWPISVTGLTASTTYYLTYFAYNGNKEEGIIGPLEYPIKTTATGVVNTTSQQIAKDTNSDSYMPSCGIADSWLTGGGTILGCIAQLAYYVVFVPSSYIFGLAGMFFDTTFNYSIQDTSYKSDFVVQGWGLVRDFCNIFFIFVLLYIAFATILSIHGFKTKEMIINVVIIGLLINFSLFASQIIIDASNILARVFYTSDAIKVTKNGVAQAGADGTVPISESIVSKINPQMLIKNANQVSVIDKSTGGSASTENTASGLGVGGFILITLLASAINIVGFIVFLSVGLIFVARSIGLWFSMIFAPLAFFSYTVPSMQNMGMVGWKKWWPETISLAFLAPIFIFFLYLILKFIQVGFGLGDVSQMTGIKFILGIILPFIFIMVLLMKAKDVAKDMSGKLGQSITGGVAAVGGLALGGAALGAAFLGRQTVGAFMKGASTGDTAAERARNGTSRGRFDLMKGRLANITGVGAAQRAVGGRLNRDQTRVEGYAHARQELDKAAGERFHGKKFNDLTQTERNTVRQRVSRDHEGQQQFGKTYSQLDAAQKATVDGTVNPQLAANTSHADHLVTEARGKQGLVSKVIQSSRSGSFDVRNLSKVVANEYDRGFSKLMTGLTATLAGGMRGAFKQSSINFGSGQKDIFKDLGNTISEALKSATVKVDLSHVGDEKKEDGHGGHH